MKKTDKKTDEKLDKKLDGQLIAKNNRFEVLKAINEQGCIREFELFIILQEKMGEQAVRRACVSAEKNGLIFRQWCCISEDDTEEEKALKKQQYYGFFLRLRTPAIDILTERNIVVRTGVQNPAATHWRHDSLAIQTLGFLQKNLGAKGIITETQLRNFKPRKGEKLGKQGDGDLIENHIWFECENAQKTGSKLDTQNEAVLSAVQKGISVYIAYPVLSNWMPINHELSLTNTLGFVLNEHERKYVNFVRILTKTNRQYQQCLPTAFEIIPMPEMSEENIAEKAKRIAKNSSKSSLNLGEYKWQSNSIMGKNMWDLMLNGIKENSFEFYYSEDENYESEIRVQDKFGDFQARHNDLLTLEEKFVYSEGDFIKTAQLKVVELLKKEALEQKRLNDLN